MERRADVQNLPATFLQLRERSAADVARAFEINVNDCAESIRRQLFSRAEKVSSRAVNHDVNLSELLDRSGNSTFDLSHVSHIGSQSNRFTAASANRFGGRLKMLH